METLVKYESPSYDKELCNQCASFLKQLLKERLGVEGVEYKREPVGNHLKFELGEGEEQLLILAHYDTVWEKGRLHYYIEGSKAYGPGILDMKGGIIQAIWALKALQSEKVNLNRKIVLLITSDEEQASLTSRDLIEQEAQQSKAVFVVEPAASTGALKTARKGTGYFKLVAEGIASHAGNHPDFHASAIHELALQISRMETLANYQAGTTINVGVIKGGKIKNVVADRAEAEIDIRFANLEEARRIEDELFQLRPILSKTKIKVEGGITRPPMEKSKESAELFDLAQQSALDLGFLITEASVGGGSDGNFTAALGIPTLDGLGAVGEGPHALHEHVLIDELPKRAALLANVLFEY